MTNSEKAPGILLEELRTLRRSISELKEVLEQRKSAAIPGSVLTTEPPIINQDPSLSSILTIIDQMSQIAGIAIESKLEERELLEELEQIQAAYHLNQALDHARDLDEICEEALSSYQAIMETLKATVEFRNRDGMWQMQAWRGLSDEARLAVASITKDFIDPSNPLPLFLSDIFQEPRLQPILLLLEQDSIRSMAFLPLVYRGRLIGNITIYYQIQRAFSDREIRLTQLLNSHIAFALDRMQGDMALRESEERLRMLAESSGDVLYRLRLDQAQFDYLSPAILRLTGYTPAEINSLQFSSLVTRIETPSGVDLTHQEFANGRIDLRKKEHRVVYQICTRSGELIWVEDHSFPWKGKDGAVVGWVGILTDITERRQAEEKLRYLGTHDALTGLFNRAYFEAELERMERSRHSYVSIIIADVDGLKAVNDSMGHKGGDDMLHRTALVLRTAFRAEDMVSRTGGDEFAILLPGTDSEAAEKAVNRLKKSLAAHNSTYSGLQLSISVGVATAEKGWLLSEALKQADERMYREKLTRTGHVRWRISS
ncbi:MAG: diguanylate cyclase [Chloroflexi bacterium]|nr:diguanylate cyclase [Chloroflexota bacterium]